MATSRTGLVDKLVGIGKRRKKLLISISSVVVLYTLLGFFLAPWLIKKTAVDTVRETYGAALSIEKVAVNPYVLSLRVDGLQMQDPDGDEFLRLQSVFANFQSSSLFRWALTFSEIRFDAPELFLTRSAGGDLNLDFLTAARPAEEEANDDGGILRLIIQDFSVNEAATKWRDEVPAEPVETSFGPVNVQVLDLNTLPQRAGQQDVVITTETAGTFSWNGSLQLNPLKSAGHASIEGSHFGLISAYVRDRAGFEVVRGNADINLDYVVETLDDGRLKATIDGLDLSLSDVLLRTFGNMSSEGELADRDVLDVPRLHVAGGSIRYPEKSVSIGSIGVDDALLSLYRDSEGSLNIVRAGAADEPSNSQATATEEPQASGADWSVSLDSFDVRKMKIGLTDDSVSPQSVLGLSDFDLSISSISNSPDARFPTAISFQTDGGGSVTSNGSIAALPNVVADMSVDIEDISLALLHPYIRPLADVSLDSGALGMDIDLHTGPDEPLSLKGDVTVSDFLITETDEGSRLGSWDAFVLDQLVFSIRDESLQISEIRIDKGYGDVFIAEDGSVNLGRVAPGVQTAADKAQEEAQEVEQGEIDSKEPAKLPFDVTIGRVAVNNASADFADFSLPLPFDAKIADLNGSLTTIATTSSEPSTVAMEGKVDEYGLVQITGLVTPLNVALNTDIKLRFENVAMPKFSAYTVPFAGREIASGKLDLNLGYAVKDSELIGENKVVLRDFELGEKVDHPGASSLPLGLAVALLKGPDGSIDLDVPVRGNVDDPNFRYGRVIGKAFVNLIVKIVASPFALLGKLVGAEADELEYILFQDGRSDLTPPEQEKAAKLAEALALRPELTMEIHGVVDRDADGLAIRSARFDAIVDEEIGTASATQSDDEMFAERRAKAIKELFEATLSDDERKAVLAEIRSQFTSTTVPQDGGRPAETFDELAYTAELRRRSIDAETVSEDEFKALASARAEAVQTAIVAVNAELARQTVVGNSKAVERANDGAIQMKVILSAGEEPRQAELNDAN